MIALTPKLTQAGMQAVFRATNDGLSARVSHMAFGAAAYAPTGTETALANERVRIPVAGGSYVGDFTIHMTGLLDTGPAFWIREVGFFLENGTLLAVWSDPATPLAYKTAGVPIVMAFDLSLVALPTGSVTVDAGDVDLTLFFAPEFAQMAEMILANGVRHQTLISRVETLERDRRLAWAVNEIRRLTNEVAALRPVSA